MTLRKELLDAITKVIPNKPGFLVIYSSFSRLSPPGQFTSWDALYSIKKLIARGWTIALPSFTFSFCKSGKYSYDKNKSETGIYADWVLKEINNSFRSKHPIYSFVLVGKNANILDNMVSTTTWGRDSIFSKFEEVNAQLLMIGCGLKSCTQIHRYEEINEVPYRHFKYFDGIADYGEGFNKTKVKMFVRNLDIDPDLNFQILERFFKKAISYKETRLFKGVLNSINTADLAKISNEQIKKNKFVLVRNSIQKQLIHEKIKESLTQPIYNIAVLGHANLNNLEKALSEKLKKYLPERRFSFYSMPYGQFSREIIESNSGLSKFKPYIKIFTSNINDLSPNMEKDNFEEIVDDYINQINYLSKDNKGLNIIFKFYLKDQFTSNTKQREYNLLIENLNKKLEDSFKSTENFFFLDIAHEAILTTTKPVEDKRLWYLGRFPFSYQWDDLISDKLSSFIISFLGKSIRAIVLDLDNTLWGGVLGEDGIRNLSIGGDFPGNIFYEFQKALLDLYERGIVLTIVSKNDEETAIKAIKNLNMPISIDKISSHRISWKNKFESIQEIANELNLGLESFLFIDDNPIERQQVLQFLPEVRILELPNDPVEYKSSLLRNPYIYSVLETLEDKKRINSYKELKELKKRKFDLASYETYLSELKMRVHFSPLTNKNINRATQLCQKTNQFNTTTFRYTSEELQNINNSGGSIIVVGLESKNSEFENIGLLVIEEDLIYKERAILQLFLLSCRVLGRGLEKFCISWCIDYLYKLNYKYLIGKIIKNNKNIPTHNLFEELKFENKDNETWELFIKDNKFENKIFRICDHFV